MEAGGAAMVFGEGESLVGGGAGDLALTLGTVVPFFNCSGDFFPPWAMLAAAAFRDLPEEGSFACLAMMSLGMRGRRVMT